jgi:hypothetical protein
MPPSASLVTLFCCSVFEKEVHSLHAQYWPECSVKILNSMLHMNQARLENQLTRMLNQSLQPGGQGVLIYGDCCTHMTDLEKQPTLARTQGHNCCEILLGSSEYHRLEHEGAFLLFPEWTHRWQTIFLKELKLTPAIAKDLLQDMHRKLVYLDTGLEPIPYNDLNSCQEFSGLPYEILPVKLDILKNKIDEALSKLELSGGRQ